MKSLFYFETPVGKVGIAEKEGSITDLFFGCEDAPENAEIKETALLLDTYKQLSEYFKKQRTAFDVPLRLEGTEFQMRDWRELLKIPYGKTISYGEIARALGIPKGARAVGLANNRNPVSIIVPCHRVIGADGKMVGYGGGLPIKKFLLDLERE